MKIKKVEIKGLFGKKDIEWELNPQVNVLVGENGSGKSTILSIIHDLLSIQANEKNISLFNTAKIHFINNSETKYLPTEDVIEQRCQEEKTTEYNPFALLPLLFIGENPVLSLATTAIALVATSKTNTKNNEKIISKSIVGENNQESLYIDTIEANLTNSNANHIIQKSNQETTNALDMEIRETIHELNKTQSQEVIDRLVLSLNTFFNQIGKNVTYQDKELVYTDIQLNKQLNYSNLSSGERQLIYILLRVALSNKDKNKNAIILMDEPEISLHVNWQADFIKQLTLLNPDAQFIIVTHSPAIIMNGWNDVYVNMEEITK